MYYWKHRTEAGTTLESELLSCKSVSNVIIASAFISADGVRILRQIKDTYSLKKENITLYLSAQFSSDKPHKILEQLAELCNTKIIFDHNFHAKVYHFRGEPDKLIYGSSNFTEGGMAGNIEFDFIGTPSPDDFKSVTSFFGACERIAQRVNAEVIQYYKDIQSDIEDLHKGQRRLSAKLTGFTHKDDSFSPDDYDIGNYYFNYEDYETFFPRNQKEAGAAIADKRKRVQTKMLSIHQQIYPSIKQLGIAHHKRKENITSLIVPHPINQYSVGWLGVRYGKTPPEVDVLNMGKDKDDDIYGFQKHGCLQYSIGSDGFDINLFLAVRHDAIDRAYLHQHLTELKPKIESRLRKLQGQGMEWVIWDSAQDGWFTFDIDNEDPEIFCDYFKENDQDGRESFLRKFYEPDDEILKKKDTICAEILRVMKTLLPLYNTMVWRPPI